MRARLEKCRHRVLQIINVNPVKKKSIKKKRNENKIKAKGKQDSTLLLFKISCGFLRWLLF